MDELTEVFGTKEEAEAYARGLRAGLGQGDYDCTIAVTNDIWYQWKVTVDYLV